MACKILCILGLIFFGFSHVNARVFYVDGPASSAPSPQARMSYGYPMMYPNEESEQASRDLDLSFSAGDPNEIPEDRGIVYPAKKMYAYSSPEKPIFEIKPAYDRPVSYRRIHDPPTRRIVYVDQYPVSDRKIMKINNNGSPKGEVILELRVTANNNNNDGI